MSHPSRKGEHDLEGDAETTRLLPPPPPPPLAHGAGLSITRFQRVGLPPWLQWTRPPQSITSGAGLPPGAKEMGLPPQWARRTDNGTKDHDS